MAVAKNIVSIEKIVSGERIHFDIAMADVKILLNIHDEQTEKLKGRPDPNLEVFKRAAVVLAITAWETFVEDTIRSSAKKIIEAAKNPQDVLSAFNHCAASWLDLGSKKPAELMRWCGDEWKKIIIDKLEEDLAALNTPNTKNISQLTKRYLGKDITEDWYWKACSVKKSAERLDNMIKLRGGLVHRGRNINENAAVVRKDVVEAIDFLPRLVECTEKSLGREPREVTTGK